MSYIAGVDIGGTFIKIGIFDSDNSTKIPNLLYEKMIDTDKNNKGENIFIDIFKCINLVFDENNLNKKDLIGIGVSVPGYVKDKRYGAACINIGWMEERDIYSEIINALTNEYNKNEIKILACNDANLAAAGEYFYGAGIGVNSIVMITLGTGIGGGIIIDGNIIEGKYGFGGEIGHIYVSDEKEVLCSCGAYGCVESFCGAPKIVKRALKLLDKSNNANSKLHQYDKNLLTPKDIFDEAKNGDELANIIVDDTAKYLGIAVSSISNTIDPDLIIFGGGVSKAGDFLFDKVRYYQKQYCARHLVQTKIVEAKLGNKAGMYGAVKLVLNKM